KRAIFLEIEKVRLTTAAELIQIEGSCCLQHDQPRYPDRHRLEVGSLGRSRTLGKLLSRSSAILRGATALFVSRGCAMTITVRDLEILRLLRRFFYLRTS